MDKAERVWPVLPPPGTDLPAIVQLCEWTRKVNDLTAGQTPQTRVGRMHNTEAALVAQKALCSSQKK